MSKTILITGANSGIGFETAKLLAQQGHTVYAAARSSEGLATIDGLKIDNLKSVKLDVTDVQSILDAKAFLEKDAGHIDVLVNNAVANAAGQKILGPTNVEISTVRLSFEVNFFGLVQTTTTLLPLVLKSAKPAIFNVSSELGSNTWQARPDSHGHEFIAYSSSKAAVNSYTIALAHELKGKAIVNALTPGFTSTRLTGYAKVPGIRTPEESAKLMAKWIVEEDKSGVFVGPDDGQVFQW